MQNDRLLDRLFPRSFSQHAFTRVSAPKIHTSFAHVRNTVPSRKKYASFSQSTAQSTHDILISKPLGAKSSVRKSASGADTLLQTTPVQNVELFLGLRLHVASAVDRKEKVERLGLDGT